MIPTTLCTDHVVDSETPPYFCALCGKPLPTEVVEKALKAAANKGAELTLARADLLGLLVFRAYQLGAEAELWFWQGRLIAALLARKHMLMTPAELEVELVRLMNELSDRLERISST